MAQGTAQRLHIADIGELAAIIEKIRPEQAIALGALRAGLPDRVQIVTKQKLSGRHHRPHRRRHQLPQG
jgi:hypothetical protein